MRKSRILQLGLLLLLIMALCGLALCLFWRSSSGASSGTVRAIERAGGFVTFKYKGPKWLKSLLGRSNPFKTADTACLKTATDQDLKGLAGFPELHELMLNGTKVSGPALTLLQPLKKLEMLELTQSSVSDDDMNYVASIHSLKKLFLARTRITDRGLADLKALGNLQELDLQQTGVTDEGMRQLAGLPLKYLNVRKTAVTGKGAALLTNAIPGLEVVR